MPITRRTCDPPLRHAWYEASGDWEPPFGGVPATFVCDRCGKERHDAYGVNTGDLVYRRYVDPPDWVAYTKDDRPTIGEMRLAWVASHITEARKARKSAAKPTNGRKAASGK